MLFGLISARAPRLGSPQLAADRQERDQDRGLWTVQGHLRHGLLQESLQQRKFHYNVLLFDFNFTL